MMHGNENLIEFDLLDTNILIYDLESSHVGNDKNIEKDDIGTIT